MKINSINQYQLKKNNPNFEGGRLLQVAQGLFINSDDVQAIFARANQKGGIDGCISFKTLSRDPNIAPWSKLEQGLTFYTFEGKLLNKIAEMVNEAKTTAGKIVDLSKYLKKLN